MFTATAFFISGFLELELSVSIYFKNTCSNKIYQILRRCGNFNTKKVPMHLLSVDGGLSGEF